jgi:hypothetical protein
MGITLAFLLLSSSILLTVMAITALSANDECTMGNSV